MVLIRLAALMSVPLTSPDATSLYAKPGPVLGFADSGRVHRGATSAMGRA